MKKIKLMIYNREVYEIVKGYITFYETPVRMLCAK